MKDPETSDFAHSTFHSPFVIRHSTFPYAAAIHLLDHHPRRKAHCLSREHARRAPADVQATTVEASRHGDDVVRAWPLVEDRRRSEGSPPKKSGQGTRGPERQRGQG